MKNPVTKKPGYGQWASTWASVYNPRMSILSPLPDASPGLSHEAEIRLAERLARGIARLFEDMGCAASPSFPLANGRRVDVIALDGQGTTSIVEIKSSVQDFRSDGKWREYLDFCDRFYFAVAPEFPQDLLPVEVGLISWPTIGMARSCANRQPSP